MTIDEVISSLPADVKDYDEIKQALEDLKDKYLRLAADFDNYRKRVSKEKEAVAFAAVLQFGESLFSAVDSIKKAVEIGCKDDPFVDGVKLALSSLYEAFSKQGFSQITPAIGDEYDVSTQEAVIAEPSRFEQNHVTKVFSSGWTLNGKLVQPAKVAVAK